MSMIITNAGRDAVAAALANNEPITVTEIAFGTADRYPTGGETALTTEVIRKAVLNYGVTGDGKTFFDARLEADDGPFVLYEIGLFAGDGTLLFVGRIEGFNKLVLADQPVTLDMRAYVLTSQFQNVVVQIDTSFAFVSAERRINTGKGLSGGGDLSRDRTLELDFSGLDALAAGAIHLTDDTLVIWDASAEAFKSVNLDAIGEKVFGASGFAGALVTLTGPALVYPGSTNTYTITNHDEFSSYAVASDVGTVSISGDTITLVIDPGEAAGGLSLSVTRNGVAVVNQIAIGAQSVAAPSIVGPSDGAVDVGAMPVLVTSAFMTYPNGADTHASTDWQIATDAAFTDIVHQSLADAVNLESHGVPSGVLSESTTYYVRAQHNGTTLGASGYSAVVSFTTKASFVPGVEVAKLVASDAAAGDFLGMSVSVSGSLAVAGAPGSASSGSYAYIFERDGSGVWSQGDKLVGSDTVLDDSYGWSVSIDGNIAVVGAYENDGAAANAGAAYIFERDGGGVWSQVAKLTASDALAGDNLCYSVSISGSYAIAGANQSDGAGPATGSAYIFERDGGGVWSQAAKLTASDAAAGSQFGSSVSIDGDIAVVGSRGATAVGDSAYIFERDGGGVWSQVAKLTGIGSVSGDSFGNSVSISGDRVVVGAPKSDDGGPNSGSAYIFERDGGGVWSQVAKLTASDESAGDEFGTSVSIDGDIAVVGAQYADGATANNSGAAYVFKRDSGGVWSEVGILNASDAADNDRFGISSALGGGSLLVGSLSDDSGADSGSAYVFN